MPPLVSAYTDDGTNVVVSVSAAFAKSRDLKTLKSDDPVDRLGRPRGPREGNRTSVTPTVTAKTTNGGSPASKPEEGSK